MPHGSDVEYHELGLEGLEAQGLTPFVYDRIL
jgi:hypothetical protein